MELGDKSAETYARDSLAAPLRSLDEVLEKIRTKAFDPDATRSGFMKRAPDNSHTEKDAEEVVSSTCPSAVSTASSLCSEDEVLAGFPVESLPEDESGTLIHNTATKCMHIVAGDERLRCGRRMPKSYEVYSDIPAGVRICPMCF